MKGDREKCQSVGCDGYLSKPVEMDSVIRAVRTAIDGNNKDVSLILSAGGKFEVSSDDSTATLRSTLPLDDPEILGIVQQFVEELPLNLDALEEALQPGDFCGLASRAHALKGSGGTAGFQCLTAPAARLEEAARLAMPVDVVRKRFQELRGAAFKLRV